MTREQELLADIAAKQAEINALREEVLHNLIMFQTYFPWVFWGFLAFCLFAFWWSDRRNHK